MIINDYLNGSWIRELKPKYEKYGIGWNNLTQLLKDEGILGQKTIYKFK